MTIIFEARPSDSPYVESVTRGHTLRDGSTIRPAETNWHMVFVKLNDRVMPLVVGPLTMSGIASWGADAEILWVKFKLGTFMPHLPVRNYLNVETTLPEAAHHSFWLHSTTWQLPDYENVETFVDRLVRNDVLVHDPLVHAVLRDEPQDISFRTVRHRFLRATGLTQNHVLQMERARRAQALLRNGLSILDTVEEAGYFDQPHLTRSLKHWLGHTPAQIIRMSQPDCQSVQDTIPVADYHSNVLANI